MTTATMQTITIEDDAMASTLQRGDQVIFDDSLQPRDGQLVAVQFGDIDDADIRVRRYVKLPDGRAKFIADNPAHEPIVCGPGHIVWLHPVIERRSRMI